MSPGKCSEKLTQFGFTRVGALDHRVHVSIWWHAEQKLQLLVLPLGSSALLKGDKSYYLKSITPEGETWARDIGLLHDYLEAHFPELRISFSHFRDVPPELAGAEARRRLAIDAPNHPVPTLEDIASLQRRIANYNAERSSSANLLSLSDTRDLLTGYLQDQTRSAEAQANRLQQQLDTQSDRLRAFRHLQREYQEKGSASLYTFSVSSNLQVAGDPAAFESAVRAVVAELADFHRFQVTQKLAGGRLNIQFGEYEEPGFAWIEQWLGGALSQAQLRRLGPELESIRKLSSDRLMVTPDTSIDVAGTVRHVEKRVAARVLGTFVQRLDRHDTDAPENPLDPARLSPSSMPLWLGHQLDQRNRVVGRAALPLTQVVHACISGTTGSGKSFLARVIVEEAAQYPQLSVLVLDPRNQSGGLLAAEDRPEIISKYSGFQMNPTNARGFPFQYYAPGSPQASVPADLASLSSGRSIVSFKSLEPQQRCRLAGDVLNAVFDGCSMAESPHPRLLLFIDEAHLFTRRRVGNEAKEAALHAERAIDRVTREGRKFGIVLVLVTQSIKDFSHDLASIRQMTPTKIFLRNSDREIAYGDELFGDGSLLAQLPTGTALLHNTDWGMLRLRVRPPLSKVFDVAGMSVRVPDVVPIKPPNTLSMEAQDFLRAIIPHTNGGGPPLNLTRAGQIANVSSKRKLLDIVQQLTDVGLVRIRQLPERGRPKILELCSPLGGKGTD